MAEKRSTHSVFVTEGHTDRGNQVKGSKSTLSPHSVDEQGKQMFRAIEVALAAYAAHSREEAVQRRMQRAFQVNDRVRPIISSPSSGEGFYEEPAGD